METLNESISIFIKNFAEMRGRSNVLVGFADVSMIPGVNGQDLQCKNAVSIVVALDPKVVSEIGNGPTLAYYNENNQINGFFDLLNEALCDFIARQGHHAQTLSQLCENLIEKEAHHEHVYALKHRVIAAHAGHGWIGKNSLIITKRFGAAVRISTVLTDAPLSCCQSVFLSRCSRCVECIKACPVGAINSSEWSINLANTDLVNVDVCRDACAKQTKTNFGIESNVCGLCIYSCPYTKSYLRRNGFDTA